MAPPDINQLLEAAESGKFISLYGTDALGRDGAVACFKKRMQEVGYWIMDITAPNSATANADVDVWEGICRDISLPPLVTMPSERPAPRSREWLLSALAAVRNAGYKTVMLLHSFDDVDPQQKISHWQSGEVFAEVWRC